MNEKLEMMRKKVEDHTISNHDGSEAMDSDLKEMLQEFMTALEELRVADDELRSQNEVLVAGRQALEEERQRYQELFELAPDAYLITDHVGVVREANQAALLLLNIDYKFLVGKPLTSFVPEEKRRTFRRFMANIDQTVDLEMTFRRRGGSNINFEAAVRIVQMKTPEGKVKGFRWVIRDITEQKRLSQELRESQERFQKIFANATLGITLLKMNRQIVDSNSSFQNLLKSRAEELQNADLARFVFKDDGPFLDACLRRLSNSQAGSSRVEIRFIRKDSSIFWGLVSFSSMIQQGGSEPYAILMVEDITVQKVLAAERIEMQHRLIDAIEAERSNLANELHDNALQTLYAALYQLVAIDHSDMSEIHKGELENTRMVISKVVNSIRLTYSELRSPSLNAFGLKKGIMAYIDKFSEINPDIDINLEFEGEGTQLSERLSLALYRILQESMSNVFNHSKATVVDITYKLYKDVISLRIADNGVGFSLPGSLVDFMRGGQYGLAGIAERVDMIGGKLKIESKPGAGTVIEVTVNSD